MHSSSCYRQGNCSWEALKGSSRSHVGQPVLEAASEPIKESDLAHARAQCACIPWIPMELPFCRLFPLAQTHNFRKSHGCTQPHTAPIPAQTQNRHSHSMYACATVHTPCTRSPTHCLTQATGFVAVNSITVATKAAIKTQL